MDKGWSSHFSFAKNLVFKAIGLAKQVYISRCPTKRGKDGKNKIF
jgi:hypothetical protein